MIFRRLLPLLLLLCAGWPADAAVTITFYSHDFGSSFPHAFVLLQGTPDTGGSPIDGNYGFTAKRITPAILMGSVEGDIESAPKPYVANSQPHWKMVLSDGQYAAVLATMEKWRSIPGKSYNLNRRNCVHFVADIARTLGMDVGRDQGTDGQAALVPGSRVPPQRGPEARRRIARSGAHAGRDRLCRRAHQTCR